MRVYLDNAATTPLDQEVLETMLPFMKEHFGNPSSIHHFGRETRAAIEKARKIIAYQFNVSPSEIFFTSGGTESNNMAIRCSVRDLGVNHIISSSIEHHCVLHTLEELKKEGIIKLDFVNLKPNGHVDLEHLEFLLSQNENSKPQTGNRKLVSLMHANNEIGNLLPLKRVGELCEKYNSYFHSDTVQTVGHYKIDLQKANVHFISGSAHKFHGPKGAGFIYISHKVKINPLIFGGAQERNMRAGTENVYGIIGLAKALEMAYNDLEKQQNYIQNLKSYMTEQLKEYFPDIAFNGDCTGSSLYTVLNVAFAPNEKTELLLFNLDIAGICASGGSACSSGSDAGSHVLSTISPDSVRKSVRFSFSRLNTKEEIDCVMKKLKEIISVKEKV